MVKNSMSLVRTCEGWKILIVWKVIGHLDWRGRTVVMVDVAGPRVNLHDQ